MANRRSRVTLSLDEYLTSARAEQILQNLSAGAGRQLVSIDVTRFVNTGFGSAARVGNGLETRRNDACRFLLPSVRRGDQRYKDLISSGLLHTAMKHAAFTYERSGRPSDLFDKAEFSRRATDNESYFVVPQLRARTDLLLVGQDQCEEVLREFLGALGVGDYSTMDRIAGPVTKLIWEAIVNVIEHSAAAPHSRPQNVDGVLVLRLVERARLLHTEGEPEDEDEFAAFWRETSAHPHGEPWGYLEVLVNDNGNGIASRHSLSDSFAMPFGEELAVVRDALRVGGTVKHRSKDCDVRMIPGFGLNHLAEALQHIGAAASLRTGRVGAVVSGSHSERGGFSILDAEFANMRGTCFCVLIPLYRRLESSVLGVLLDSERN